MPYWDKQQVFRLAIMANLLILPGLVFLLLAKAMAHQPWRHPLIGMYYSKDS